jgi:hypothetical protein
MEVPLPSKKSAVADRNDDAPPRRRRDYEDEDDRPRRSHDDDDFRPVRRRRRRSRATECPNCGCEGDTYERKEIPTEGWIIMVVLLLTFFPLFFIGLLMKQNYLICGECGFKIRKLDGVTFG